MTVSEIFRNNILSEPIISFRDLEPCGHIGCIAHRTHPCEVCGRISAKGNISINNFEYDKRIKRENKCK
jgi:hypothetical protein